MMKLLIYIFFFVFLWAQASSKIWANEDRRSPDFLSSEPKVEVIESGILSSEERAEALTEIQALRTYEQPFKIQEYQPNYFIYGEPDTKVQFSFKFKVLKSYDLYFAYTQRMFWDLGQKDSSPFSDVNYHPELFYHFKFRYPIFFDELGIGYSHISNGRDSLESRSVDELFLALIKDAQFGFGFSKIELRLRYVFESTTDNIDIHDFYGPAVLKLYFTKLGRRLFFSEELYAEYYNGGRQAEDFSKGSVRVSFRFKAFKPDTAPKVFLQYFNGYGENLMNYNKREESFRIGLSIGGE